MAELWDQYIHNSFLVQLSIAVLEVAIGFVIAPTVRSWILRINRKKQKVDQGVLTFSASLASILIKFLSIVIAMAQLGVNTDMIVGAFSAIGLGVSLALRESMANVAGGVQILLTHPFKVGDYIQFDQFEGTCQEIELMFTTLKTYSNEEIIIPNSSLVTDTVVNFSKYPNRRIKIDVECALNEDYEKFSRQIVEWMESEPLILKDPEPVSRISGFTVSGNGLILSFLCYASIEEYWDAYYKLLQEIQQQRILYGIQQPVDKISIQEPLH